MPGAVSMIQPRALYFMCFCSFIPAGFSILFQEFFYFRNRHFPFPQLPDISDPLYAFHPAVSSGQVLLRLFKRQHSLFGIKLQRTVPHPGQPHQFPDGHIFRMFNCLYTSLSRHQLTFSFYQYTGTRLAP